MSIKINKELPLGNTGLTLTHWLVVKVVEDTEKEQAIFKLLGFSSAAKRNEGLYPVDMKQAQKRFVVKNYTEVDPDTEVETVIDDYTKWSNRKLTDAELALRTLDGNGVPIIRAKHIQKSQILWYLSTLPEFDGMVEE